MRLVPALVLIGCIGSGPEAPSELRIVEYQALPFASGGPWLEVRNGRLEAVDVLGLEVEVGGVLTVVDGSLVLEPGETLVIGTTAAADEGIPVDVIADEFLIDPAGETFRLALDGVDLQFLQTDSSWPSPEGASVSLHPDFPDASDPVGWCDGWSVGPGGDFGTPGTANDLCSCTMPFDYAYTSPNGPDSDITGSEFIRLRMDGSYLTGGESGTYTRWTDSLGQHIEWRYPTTNIVYRGVRPFGTGVWTNQPIEIPPDLTLTATSGTWSATGPCAP